MKENYKQFIQFLKSFKYIVPVMIVSILSYGFELTHSAVNIDTLSYDRYFIGNELLRQGRFFGPLLDKIFRVMNYNPFFVDFLAVLFLIVGSTLFCVLFKKVFKDKLNDLSYTIFACLFISYPLIPEIFTYTPASLSIGLGYTFVALSLIIVYDHIKLKTKKINYLIAAIPLLFSISLYESFAAVYLLGIMLILFSESHQEKKKLKPLIIEFFKYLLPLILALLLNFIITSWILNIFNLPSSTNVDKNIYYKTLGIKIALDRLYTGIINYYLLAATYYIPLTILLGSLFLFIIYNIIFFLKKRSIILILLFLGIIIATISLSLIQGQAAPYRTCQTFSLLVSFVFLFLTTFLTSKTTMLIKTFVLFSFIVVFFQCKFIHKIFYINYLRSEEEKEVLKNILFDINQNYNSELPVVFIGSYKLSSKIQENLYVSKDSLAGKVFYKTVDIFDLKEKVYSYDKRRIGQTNINSYINWGMLAFGQPDIELKKWVYLLGYDIEIGTEKMRLEAIEKAKDLNQYPKKGYIFQTEEYIIVNF